MPEGDENLVPPDSNGVTGGVESDGGDESDDDLPPHTNGYRPSPSSSSSSSSDDDILQVPMEQEGTQLPTGGNDFDWKPGDPLGQVTFESTGFPPNELYPPEMIVYLIKNGDQQLFCARNRIPGGSIIHIQSGQVQFDPKIRLVLPDYNIVRRCRNACIRNSYCDDCRVVVVRGGNFSVPVNEYFRFPRGTRIHFGGRINPDDCDYFFSLENSVTYDLSLEVVYDREEQCIVFPSGMMYYLPVGYYYRTIGQIGPG